MHSLKNTHNHKKELCRKKNFVDFCKKIPKKFPKKKFKKKLKKGYQDFHAPKQGGGGYGLYTCVMVVTHLYTCTGTEIGTKIGRHKDREVWRWREAIHHICLLSGVCRLSFHFGSFRFDWFGSDFLTSIKKFFNFPIFFSNYLIFNAFQI